MPRFLVTSANSFIGLHVVDQLLKEGHFVRGAVRCIRCAKSLEYLRKLPKFNELQLELIEADLLDYTSWLSAVQNIDYIIHFTSPFPLDSLSNSEGLIEPSVLGTLNVLNAALNSNIKRLVVNSCGSTIAGCCIDNRMYNENDWADPKDMMLTYGKTKVIAEQVVWRFLKERKLNNLPCYEIAVVNPAIRPCLSPTISAKGAMLLNIFNNQTGIVPDCHVFICDVRDVAQANIRAAFSPFAAGHRHLISSTSYAGTIKQWAEILKAEFEPKGFKISTTTDVVLDTNKIDNLDTSRMRNVLCINPIDVKKTIIDTIYSFFQHGIIRPNANMKKKSFSFINDYIRINNDNN